MLEMRRKCVFKQLLRLKAKWMQMKVFKLIKWNEMIKSHRRKKNVFSMIIGREPQSTRPRREYEIGESCHVCTIIEFQLACLQKARQKDTQKKKIIVYMYK